MRTVFAALACLLTLSGCPDEPYELGGGTETGEAVMCDDSEAADLDGCLDDAEAARVACRASCGGDACSVGMCEQACGDAFARGSLACEAASVCGEPERFACVVDAIDALGACPVSTACEGGSACLAEWQALVGECLG